MKKAIPFKKHFALLTACILSAVMLTVFSLSADALELPEYENGVITNISNSSILANMPEETVKQGDDINDFSYLIEVIEQQEMTVCNGGKNYTVPIEIEWSFDNADTSQLGYREIVGKIIPPEGCTFADGVIDTVIIPFTVIPDSDSPVEITDIFNYQLIKSGVMLAVGDEDCWNETVEYWYDFLGSVTGYTEYGDEAVLILESLDISDVNINAEGEYTVTAMFALDDEYNNKFFISDELRTIKIPVRISNPDNFEIQIIGQDTGCFMGVYLHNQDSEVQVYYVESENELMHNKLTEYTALPADENLAVAGGGIFRIFSYSLNPYSHYYFYLECGEERSNYIHIYYDENNINVSEFTGGDRDGGDAGSNSLPDYTLPYGDDESAQDNSSKDENKKTDLTENEKEKSKVSESPKKSTSNIQSSTNDLMQNFTAESTTVFENTTHNYAESQTEIYDDNNDEGYDNFTEIVTETKDIISGYRLNLLLQNNDYAVFSKGGITVQIPRNTIEKLNVSDNDRFSVEIIKTDENTVTVTIFFNNSEITLIEGMKIIAPFDYESGNITVKEVNNGKVINSTYDKASNTVSFLTGKTGTFKITCENSSFENTDINTTDQGSSGVDLFLIVVAVLVLLTACVTVAVLLFRRRKR